MVIFKTRLFKALAAFVLLLAVAGCDVPVIEWNQKFTVNVETPNGNLSGSSVLHQWYADRSNNPQFGSGNVHAFDVKGEAVVVDLGTTPKGLRYLFLLAVRSEYTAMSIGAQVFGLPKAAYEDIAPKLAKLKGAVEVPSNLYSLMVTFDDINDPASVKRVDPTNLAATFGRGYALQSITLEITDEPVTEGKVESVLGWLEDIGRGRGTLIPYPKGIKSTELTDPEIQRLEPSAFSTELYK